MQSQGLLRLRTLVRLRWLAVIGQSIAVLGVQFVLGFKLPLALCLAMIALSAWLNIFLSLRWRSGQRMSARPAGLLLGYDVVQLAILLYLTGGLQNPFAFLFLVPVTISATSLPLPWTLTLAALAFACSSVLAVYHRPLPWLEGAVLSLPPTYIAGMWAALVCGTVFSAIYARRIAEEARLMSAALSATELVLAREQRLSALDGLAAAAAHELGTPLATIALVAKELKRESPKNSPYAEDIDLLISQAARCRDILKRLAAPEELSDDIYQQVTLEAMIEDMVAPLRGSDVKISIDAGSDGKAPSPAPIFRRNPAITYGLSNLLENAFDFAVSAVEVKARWSASQVIVTVADDGPGFDQSIFDQLGDPFVTTRPGYGDGAPKQDGQHEGMGLGLFIAKTLLERSGAFVALANRKAPQAGALIQITWPRVVVDVGKNA
ncbi:MAG: ActS/PrrB/RegB family redox-sensitive histidine kinase [Alphaproteobacteria bacterium]|nr:ActS/PrrB/RegB family redox-sensitive histidine kinase [Alphaproteobacteria bacterium]